MAQKTTTSSRRELIESKLAIDPAKVLAETTSFVKSVLRTSGAAGFVVGLSGGVDSAVTAAICAKAVGSDKVTGLLLFEKRMMDGQDFRHARWAADFLGLETLDISIDPAFNRVVESMPFKADKVTLGNLKARIRMMSLYFVANSRNLLVVGTGDRSEDLIGYFTKYGDGGVDLLPIAHLYKSQVRQLGRYLGLPPEVVGKASSPNLWEGHKATDEIPFDYDTLDRVLACMFERNMTPEETATELGVELEGVRDILRRYQASAHKRSYPPMVRSW